MTTLKTNPLEKELKKDHKKVKEMMKEIESALEDENTKEAKEIFTVLKKELLAHSKAEDIAYYSKLDENEKTKDIILEGREEHHVVEMLLDELEAMKVDPEEWKAKFKVLRENVEHHVEEEEEKMFKKAEKVLSDDLADVTGEQQTLIRTQHVVLKADHDTVKALRDALVTS